VRVKRLKGGEGEYIRSRYDQIDQVKTCKNSPRREKGAQKLSVVSKSGSKKSRGEGERRESSRVSA